VRPSVVAGKYHEAGILKRAGAAKRAGTSINSLGFGVSRIISDTLQASGQKTIILLSEQPTAGANSNSKILKRLFISRFSRPVSRYKISAALLYKLLLSLGESRDAETLLDFFKAALNKTHFPQHTGLFLLFSRALQYVWPFLKKELGARGLYISYSGKLSRHLLTKSRTLRLSVGKTGANTNNAVVYAYRQT